MDASLDHQKLTHSFRATVTSKQESEETEFLLISLSLHVLLPR
jgi:hypothetical protein